MTSSPTILDTITTPADLRRVNERDLRKVADELRNLVGPDVFNIRLPVQERLHLRSIDIEPDDAIADLAVPENQRKADIAKSDDSNSRGSVGEFIEEL